MIADKDAHIAELEARSDRLYQLNVDAAKEFRSERLELERKLAERDEEHDSLVNMLNMEIERLTNKLVEQQAQNLVIRALDNLGVLDDCEELNNLLAKAEQSGYDRCVAFHNSIIGGACSTFDLLAKAKEEGRKEAVPEGCQVVQIPQLLFEAWDYGQFSDNFDRPIAKPIRAAIRDMLTSAPKTLNNI